MYVATKTISIDLVAYETLRRARIRPDESFSQVIRRGHWDNPQSTAASLLEALAIAPLPSEKVLSALERAQASDEPPSDPWQE
ncbi:MAG: antitoxin VapB family protein [Proteobacteria bacterium]|nr:antitoxin VapB family protein [Pseudomonadota bacterium]